VVKNFRDLLKQAQKLQAKIAEIQKDLAGKTVEVTAGGGMVTVTVSGTQEIMKIKIDPAVVNSGDIEMLEDLIVAAVNEGLRKARELATDEMSRVTGGLGIPFPGWLQGE